MENQPLIYQKIVEVMSSISAISKDRDNQGQHFKYRGIDDVMNELHPTLAKCGVFVVPNVLEETRSERDTANGKVAFYTRLKIQYSFYAADGSHIDTTVIGEAMDTGDKASNKALSVGMKYACLQVFCIPTEDDKDPDGESFEIKANEKPAPRTTKPQTKTYTKPETKPQQQAPANTNNSKFYKPAGGPDTQEQTDNINSLLHSVDKNGAAIFPAGFGNSIGEMRRTKTADEVIAYLRAKVKSVYDAQSNRPEPAPQQAQPSFDDMANAGFNAAEGVNPDDAIF